MISLLFTFLLTLFPCLAVEVCIPKTPDHLHHSLHQTHHFDGWLKEKRSNLAGSGVGFSSAEACGQATMVTATKATFTTLGSVISGMTIGAVTALSTSAALALLNSNGNLDEAFKTLFSDATFKNTVMGAITGGVTEGFMNVYNIPTCAFNRTFIQNIQINSVRAGSYLATRTALYGEEAFKNIEKDALNIVIQAACADLCQRVGAGRSGVDAAGNPIAKMDYFSHKLFHAGIGALGAATGGSDAMASAAAGAALGEVLGEFLADSKKISNQMMTDHPDKPEKWHSLVDDQLKWNAFLTKIGAAVMVSLGGGDFHCAHDAADRAIENNLVPTVLGALYTLSVSKSLYDGYTQGGFEGLLKAAGIEVVWAGVGAGAAKMISHFKVGDKVFNTLTKATDYVCENSPTLQKTLSFLTDKLIAFEKAYSQSTIGQGIEAFESSMIKAASGMSNAFKGMFAKAGVEGVGNSHIKMLSFNPQARNLPGTAHISKALPQVQNMLRGTHNNVGIIPDEIGVLLQGKTFKSFDDFRSTFWKTVAQTKYAQEFGAMNMKRMSKGIAPQAMESQQLGKRMSYELHHKQPIVQNGAVYDISNMIIVTPRHHQEILKKGYHYGK